jgi:hypothetical protein
LAIAFNGFSSGFFSAAFFFLSFSFFF